MKNSDIILVQMGPGSGHYTTDPRTIVEEHYRDIHRQVRASHQAGRWRDNNNSLGRRLTSSWRARRSWWLTARCPRSGPTPCGPATATPTCCPPSSA